MNNISGVGSKWALDMAAPGAGTQSAGLGSKAEFTEIFSNMLENVSKSQQKATENAMGLQMNNPAISVEDVAITSNEASLKFQTVLQVRNKLLQAYSEVMNMPV